MIFPKTLLTGTLCCVCVHARTHTHTHTHTHIIVHAHLYTHIHAQLAQEHPQEKQAPQGLGSSLHTISSRKLAAAWQPNQPLQQQRQQLVHRQQKIRASHAPSVLMVRGVCVSEVVCYLCVHVCVCLCVSDVRVRVCLCVCVYVCVSTPLACRCASKLVPASLTLSLLSRAWWDPGL